jgi:hypothetical protein
MRDLRARRDRADDSEAIRHLELPPKEMRKW